METKPYHRLLEIIEGKQSRIKDIQECIPYLKKDNTICNIEMYPNNIGGCYTIGFRVDTILPIFESELECIESELAEMVARFNGVLDEPKTKQPKMPILGDVSTCKRCNLPIRYGYHKPAHIVGWYHEGVHPGHPAEPKDPNPKPTGRPNLKMSGARTIKIGEPE